MNLLSGTKSNNIDIEQNEKDFQTAFDQGDWEKMWWCVFYTCQNIAKSIYKKRNVIVEEEELYDVIIDGAAYCMKFIKKGVRPEKLSSYCFLRVRRFIDNPKKVWEEQNITQFPVDNNGKEIEYGRSE